MQQSRWSHFSVNRTHHLLSFATKMSTLGDWCAGVSMLDLCLPNCSWVESISLDLFPWDAGLDEEDVSRGSNNKNNNNFADNLFRKKDRMSYTATKVSIPNPVALLKIKRIQQRDKTSVGNTSNNATSINNNNINNINNNSNTNNNISNVNNNNSSVCYNVLTDETADEEIATSKNLL
ncbi:hypothetical protein HELRODRAFT_163455 [Helobdella robusta]|uniref:Spondin domain-containing protein n=1 Tax=Helobdella robusta TaxID=6412 RepID=T1EU27_HELRO|nr:hypothetical protein HELRODRAFT_163455 [Helobdella robusta]ESN96395.1 hypothetical protein HELRODRAFT_163455 [Helobdella robusta]